MEALFLEKCLPLPKDGDAVPVNVVVQQVLSFLLAFARDQVSAWHALCLMTLSYPSI